MNDEPTEAEAYWGLVLCKYGIEYVDDPATGKKVPTCHRSSFESVLEDKNFEQVMETADPIARKFYREEAKQIEELRKGIIEVSSKEEPYDIFICYKETDENGERTIDSVIAQDVYSALTDKGYRVFFSRITLEDKLGQEYEPYIFAALNSAKIMLAFGTDYEYYNAVWVKNEWSRYLKLMASDKSKHLIPCYKGIDAYDMPKEFARLQAQDMGKVGAMQDLLRGIEKILPKAAPVTVVQERVVVGGSGDNKIASLLDRGNMALEDGDWAKADSFFEDVLNNDSKNAQAYLGKTLAQEKCRTIDAFARKRKKETQYAQPQKLRLEPNEAHVDEMVGRSAIPGYVQQDEIRKLYQFDLSYTSEVAERMHQHRDEVNFWANHKLLSRAEKFAAGAVAENFQREKKALFAALADRVKQAENAEAAAKTDVQERYEAHLKQADQQAEALYNAGVARREAYYQELLGTAKQSSDIAELTNTAKKFDQLGDYQDSRNLAEHCRKRAAEEQAKLDAEKERQRVLAAKREKERKTRNTRLGILAGIAAVVVIAVIVVMNTVVIPGQNYAKAEALLAAGEYEEAIAAFEALGDYKDSAVKTQEAQSAVQAAEQAWLEQQKADRYAQAMAFLEAEDYEQALNVLTSLGNYQNSEAQAELCRKEIDYAQAMNYLDANKDQKAYELLSYLGDFRDALDYLSRFAMRLVSSKYTWSDGSGSEDTYEYDNRNRLTTVYLDGKKNTSITYHDNGVPSTVNYANGGNYVYYTEFEKGYLASFGDWKFTPVYGGYGRLTELTGVCSSNKHYDEPGEEWKLELAEGDVIEIPALDIGPLRHTGSREASKIMVLRADGKVRGEYIFTSSYVYQYIHQLDGYGNTCKIKQITTSVAGAESVYEVVFQLTYNEKHQLMEKRFEDPEGKYTARLVGLNGYGGSHVITYTYSEDGKTIVAEWTCNGRLLRKDTFTYEPVYNP